ncbi:MAG: hypothetical protein QOJ35_383 [Solirubrobacteraceae bacterium]|nr:hypothetical protein [Solirubrobacteraceae bacterium]
MTTASRTRTGAALATLAILAPAAPATGAGSPLPNEDSPSGVLARDGQFRYLSVSLRNRTAVLQQRAATGIVSSRVDLRGRFGIPLVAFDTTAGGISADGGTLVLIRPRTGFPRRRTTLAIVGTKRWLRLRRPITLRGDFSYDALSPDGRALFLINYISPRDPSKYRVRVYDLVRNRLEPKPIVDPRESPDAMNGVPLTRVMSRDGRWAYTLYDGQGDKPFIHALDTRDRKAVCIDLDDPAFAKVNAFELRLAIAAGGARLDVTRKHAIVATVDTATFRVAGGEAARAAARGALADVHHPWSVAPWSALAAALLAAGLGAALIVHRRGRAPLGSPRAEGPAPGARGRAAAVDPGARGTAGGRVEVPRQDVAEARDQPAGDEGREGAAAGVRRGPELQPRAAQDDPRDLPQAAPDDPQGRYVRVLQDLP